MKLGNWLLKIIITIVPIDKLAVKLIAYLTKEDDKVIGMLLNQALDLVAKVDKTYENGTEKREAVFHALKEKVDGLADYIINLIIEIAVAMLKSRLKGGEQ